MGPVFQFSYTFLSSWCNLIFTLQTNLDASQLLDTAQQYKTEKGVGDGIKRAIAEGLVERKDLFITTKFPPKDQPVAEVVCMIFSIATKDMNLSVISIDILILFPYSCHKP